MVYVWLSLLTYKVYVLAENFYIFGLCLDKAVYSMIIR